MQRDLTGDRIRSAQEIDKRTDDNQLQLAMLIAGVDVMGAPGGVVPPTQGNQEMEQAVSALQQAVRLIEDEGGLLV